MFILLSKKKGIALGLFIIFIFIFIFSLYKIVINFIEIDENNRLYKEIVDNSKINEIIIDEEDMKEQFRFIHIDFTDLLQENSDTKGWISFGYIDYVFVQASNNDYYLRRNFKKEYSQYGTLFLDYRNHFMYDKNTVIYGHNSTSMSMFGSLKTLLNKKYFDSGYDDMIKISTPIANYNYQIFSVYNIEKEDYYITTSFTTNEFKQFIDIIGKRSYYDFDLSVDTNDKILTLSTCYGGAKTTKRTVIHAKLIETMKR